MAAEGGEMGWWSKFWRGKSLGWSSVLTGNTNWIPAYHAGTVDEVELARSPSAGAALLRNVSAAAQLPPRVLRYESGDWVPARHPEIERWLRRPGAGAGRLWTWGQLVGWILLQRALHGYARLRVIRVNQGRELYALEPLEWGTCSPVYGRGTYEITGWRVAGVPGLLEVEDVLTVRGLSPSAQSEGLPIWALTVRPREVEDVISRRQVAQATNRGAPGAIIAVEGINALAPAAGTISTGGEVRSQKEAFEQTIAERFARVSTDGAPLVLGGKATISPAPEYRPERYNVVRQAATDEMHEILGAPAGDTKEARRTWWYDVVQPSLQSFLDDFALQVLEPLYGPEWIVWCDTRESQFALALEGDKLELAASCVRDLGVPANTAIKHYGVGVGEFAGGDVANVMFTIAGRTDSETNTAGATPRKITLAR